MASNYDLRLSSLVSKKLADARQKRLEEIGEGTNPDQYLRNCGYLDGLKAAVDLLAESIEELSEI